MNSSTEESWSCEYAVETSASPEAIWRLFSDVPGWKNWNPGVERIEIHGPFAAGTTFEMTPPGQETITSVLVEVREPVLFVDETRVDNLVVRVAHRIEPMPSGRNRVVYAVEAAGPGCSEIGPMVSSDFPEVLKGLAALAESEQTHR